MIAGDARLELGVADVGVGMMEEIDAPMPRGSQRDLAAERDGGARRGPADLEPRRDRLGGLGEADIETVHPGDEMKNAGVRGLRPAVDKGLGRSLGLDITGHVHSETDDPLRRRAVADEKRGREDIETGALYRGPDGGGRLRGSGEGGGETR